MDLGIGLPTTIPGVKRRTVLDWARAAEDAGFSTLGTIDRIVYGNHEPLTALAAAGAVTERIRLATAILIAPLRSNAALLAKQAATVDVLSEGRLTLGLAVGGREDDYAAGGVDFHHRGKLFDEQLETMQRVWKGESFGFAGPVGPAPGEGRPQVLIGGSVPAAFERAARYAAGWIAGGGGPDAFAGGAEKTKAAWSAAGREGSPRLAGLGYFALGDDPEGDANRYLRDYYGFLPDQVQDFIVGSASKGEQKIRDDIAAFERAGCEELILFPCSPDPKQVELLAAAVR
jgi:alkanesulfonate monooxygenase SsuD/methylene tetrahydromethanopterin reductase-like flavin-dependent oxidoreductase (luciferase family)